MKAIILAAGRGSRMKGQTEARPKCLVVLAGRTLLSLQMAALKHAGVGDIGIVTGYRGEMLRGPETTTFENTRWSETNMVVSLCQADAWLSAEDCIVSYADIFYAAETVTRLMRAPGGMALTYDPDWLALWQSRFADPLSDAESFMLNARSEVIDIGRKVSSLDEVTGQYMGLLRFTPGSWAAIKDFLATLEPMARDKMDMTSLLSAMIKRGEKIVAVPTYPGWGEIDSESDLAYYEGEVAAGRLVLAAG
jgi:choline kinase